MVPAVVWEGAHGMVIVHVSSVIIHTWPDRDAVEILTFSPGGPLLPGYPCEGQLSENHRWMGPGSAESQVQMPGLTDGSGVSHPSRCVAWPKGYQSALGRHASDTYREAGETFRAISWWSILTLREDRVAVTTPDGGKMAGDSCVPRAPPVSQGAAPSPGLP